MRILEILSAIGVVVGWCLILISVVAFLLFWRVDNEPGVAKEIAQPYWRAAILSSLSGGLLFVASNLYLLLAVTTKTPLWIAWAVVAGITLLACLASPLLLILMA